MVKNLTCQTQNKCPKTFEKQKDAAVCILPIYEIGHSHGGNLKRKTVLWNGLKTSAIVPELRSSLLYWQISN